MERESGRGTVEKERQSAPTREGARPRETGVAGDNARLARRLYEELWNARDFNTMVRLAAEDVECVNVAANTTLRGRDGYREFAEGWAAAFPDGKVEVKRVFATEDGAVVELVGRGTHTGPLAGPTGTIAPTGRKAELSLCDVLEIENGALRRFRSYYDSASLMRQLGVMR